jgi:hypothetical protein
MGIHRGPNIVKDDLVFGYDTGYGVADNSTATRFYPGKSVDNEFYNSGANGNILDHSSGYGGYGTVQTGVLDASGTTQNAVYRKTGKIRFGPTGGQDIGTLTNGNTYTFSIYLRHVAGQTESTSMEFDIVDQSSGGYNYTGTLGSNMTYEWKRFSVTSTHTNSSNYHFIDLGTYQGTNVFEWCMPQIELGTVASPFTSTERSSTASLIDLKRTTDIDVSNVSFDSTGQPEFDGTNDYLDLGSDREFKGNGGDWTSEHIVKYDVVPAGYNNSTSPGNFLGGSTTYNSWYWSVLNSKLALWNISPGVWKYGSTTLVANTWYHAVLVCEPGGTSYKMYLNGVEEGGTNASYVYNASYSGIKARYFGVGYAPGTRTVNGKIPVTKIYDRALSAQEIKDNFNAYKNRFNI